MSDAMNESGGFIVFADDWGGHPSSSQHLFRRIAAKHDVLWVNTIGMRRPRLTRSDFGKAWAKLRRMFRRGADQPQRPGDPPRLHVCQPFMLPFAGIGAVRRFNAHSVRRVVRQRLDALGLQKLVLVAAAPAAGDVAGDFGEDRIVYYCVDDFSNWAGFDHDLVRNMEARLIERTDVAIATSHLLQSLLQAQGKDADLLPHGADISLFSAIPEREHPLLADIKGPRVGYFGAIDERLDDKLLAGLARARPDIAFILAGPRLAAHPRLETIANVHFIGEMAYANLPYLVAGLSALLLPYRVDRSTAAISPLKLKEYLATARPVIVSGLAEVNEFASHLVIAREPKAWLDAIDSAAGKPLTSGQQAIPKWLAQEGWDRKADQFLQMIRR